MTSLPTWADPISSLEKECHVYLDRPSDLPIRHRGLRDGTVKERILALAANVADAEKTLGITPEPHASDADVQSNYEGAMMLISGRLGIVYAHAAMGTDADSRRLEAASADWVEELSQLGTIIDVDHRTYFDRASGKFLLRVQGYDRKRSENFRSGREGKVFKVTISNGRLETMHGPLDGERLIFGWNRRGELRVAPQSAGIYHDDLFPHEDVAMVGELSARRGLLHLITDQSGHFHPSRLLMEQFLEWLVAQNVAVPRVVQFAPE